MFAAHLAGGGTRVSLSGYTVVHVNAAGARAAFRLGADGKAYTATAMVETYRQDWVQPLTDAGLYEVRATLQSGTVTSGPFGTWDALSSDREWVSTSSPGTFRTGTFLVEIRDAATSTVRASATILLESEAP